MSVFTVLASDFPLEEVPPPPGLQIFLEPGKREAEYRNAGIGADELTAEDIRELERVEVWREDPVTGRLVDYCFLLTK